MQQLLDKTKSKKRHPGFAPSLLRYYYLGPAVLDFADRTGYGIVTAVWTLHENVREELRTCSVRNVRAEFGPLADKWRLLLSGWDTSNAEGVDTAGAFAVFTPEYRTETPSTGRPTAAETLLGATIAGRVHDAVYASCELRPKPTMDHHSDRNAAPTTNRRGSVLPTGKARPTCTYRVRLPVIYPTLPSHTFLKHPRTRVWTARPGNLGAKRTRKRSFRRRVAAFGALVPWRDGRETRYNRGFLRSRCLGDPQ